MPKNRAALVVDPKSMGCIVNDLQSVGIGDFLDAGNVTGVAVTVNCHDGRS